MKDAVAFMAWERVVPWKILSMMAHPDEPLVPIGFGSRNCDFHKLLEPGSQIWVVTRISGEFSLAGRVTVRDIVDRNCISQEKWPNDIAGLLAKWRFVARADPQKSEFFETNRAEPIMVKHNIRFAQNRTIAYCDSSVNESFKACIDQARETVFLSYRWQEGRRFAIALAREFRQKGLSPWLDALSIPAYEAKREPGVNAPRLKKLIKLGIRKSKLAVVINTETFAKAGWTRFELDHIRRNDILCFQVMRGGTELKCGESAIFSRKPEDIVQEIREQLTHRAGSETDQHGHALPSTERTR